MIDDYEQERMTIDDDVTGAGAPGPRPYRSYYYQPIIDLVWDRRTSAI